jgi:hypothetical protein
MFADTQDRAFALDGFESGRLGGGALTGFVLERRGSLVFC